MIGSAASARLDIDLDALAGNYRLVCQTVAPAAAGGVVKADAYGLGAWQAVSTLLEEGCRHFFVAHLDEAAAIARIMRPDARLYVLNGIPEGAEAECRALGVVPVINSIAQLERWAGHARAVGTPLDAALQFDTGMARLGIPGEDVAALRDDPALLAPVRPVLLMSHLACADDPGSPANLAQKRRFDALAAAFPGIPRSLANSGGAFMQGFAGDVVRPGIALYGGAPHGGAASPMRAVVGLRARIVQIRTVGRGEAVGYGFDWTAPRISRIATIGVGYADGWPRTLGNRGAAYLGGVRTPIVGRVSMDSITLDVTDVPERAIAGEFPIELLGPSQTIDDVARDAGTISYEILTRLGRRYARTWHAARARQGVAA